MKTIALLVTLNLFFALSITAPFIEKSKQHDQISDNAFLNEYEYYMQDDTILLRSGAPSRKWPNDTVYYMIKNDEFDTSQLTSIYAAMDHIQNVSCVRFKLAENEKVPSYALFTGKYTGCHSNIGYAKGVRSINLHAHDKGKGCFAFGTILHEILHILGFYHQHCIYNRDDYIDVHMENVLPGFEGNFKKLGKSFVSNFGVPYDYNSVLQYNERASAKKGTKAMEAKENTKTFLGQRVDFSIGDIVKLNRMYECCEKNVNNREIIRKFCEIKWD